MKMKLLLTWLCVMASSMSMSALGNYQRVYPSITDPLVQQAKLIAADGGALDVFGVATALSSDGNTAIAGARGVQTNQGAAYIFTRSDANVWSEQVQLTAADGDALDAFGWSVALSSDGETAIVGASMADVTGNANQGAAYVFVRSGTSWSQQAKLTAGDGAVSDGFGFFVALSSDGDTAFASAYLADVSGITNQGAAYVFTRSDANVWSEQAKLTAADGALNDEFGWSVALNSDGNTAIAGAHYADVGTNANQGAAYVFTRSSDTWSEQAKLTAADGAASDLFGVSVALSSNGNTAVASAPLADVSGNANQGAAYVFTRSDANAWSEQQKLISADGAMNDQFGISVSLNGIGDTAIAGANYADVGTNANQGAAYVFAVLQPPAAITATYDFYIDRVRVSWDAAAGATGYKVWRGGSNNTGLSTNIAAVSSGTNYDDMAATAGTPYYYWVTSTKADGTSTFSSSAIGRVLFGPDVRVNGEAGPVTLAAGSALVVTVSLNPAQYAGYPMDWWVVVLAPSGLYYLNASLAWTTASAPVYQGGLFGLQSYVVLDITTLPPGTYTFYFGVDTLNGILDPDVVYDNAIVTVAP